MKAAIYSRKSKLTGKGESTQNQIELCKEYGIKHFKIKEFIIYEDEGFSGGNVYRPEFQKMLHSAKRKEFDLIICYRLDRISRNILDFSNLIELIQSHNIGFISIREQFDTSTPMGRAMMYIASVFAQLERETAAERIRDNMLQLARTGRWLGGNTPTGFESKPIIYLDSNMKEKKLFKLAPILEELDLVKLIYKQYLNFQSLSKLETYCLHNNIKTKKNKDFHKHSLKNILTNPVYVKADTYAYNYFNINQAQIYNSKEEFTGKNGIMAYNKNLVKKGKYVKPKNMCEWIIAIGSHEGIIGGKTWVKVQEIINKNKSLAPRYGTSNTALLSGFLRCGKCGSFMKVKYGQIKKDTNTRHYYYVCNTKEISKKKLCTNKNLIGEKTDTRVMEILMEKINSDFIEDLDKIKADLNIKDLEKRKIEQKIKSNEKAIDNLLKQLSHNEESLTSKYIFKEIEKLAKEKIDLESKLHGRNTGIDFLDLDLIKGRLIKLPQTFLLSTNEENRIILNSIIDKIEWDGEELNIEITLH
ncbi:MAG: recombinase family protein [Clostridia bacterium]|nr:recombinase family protein [Clostridia bacterium]